MTFNDQGKVIKSFWIDPKIAEAYNDQVPWGEHSRTMEFLIRQYIQKTSMEEQTIPKPSLWKRFFNWT